MNLTIFNGSPRLKKSNSTFVTDHFLSGYRKVLANGSVNVKYLAKQGTLAENVEAFNKADHIIIIFPLYTDSMPGVVKEFFEHWKPNAESPAKSIGFIVQSGFPEAVHSTFVEKYLTKLVKRLGYNYLGCVVKGGVEGIQVMPAYMTKKTLQNFIRLGEHFARHKKFVPEIVAELKGNMRMNTSRRLAFRFMKYIGLVDFYWNTNLKKHDAWEKRFDKPLLTKD